MGTCLAAADGLNSVLSPTPVHRIPLTTTPPTSSPFLAAFQAIEMDSDNAAFYHSKGWAFQVWWRRCHGQWIL